MAWVHHNIPRQFTKGVQFVWYSNEDLGFTITLDATTATYSASYPFPSSVDLFDETITVEAIDYMFLDDAVNMSAAATEAMESLGVFLSMLNVNFAAAFRGIAADTEDEALKSKFDGPWRFGKMRSHLEVASQVGLALNYDNLDHVRYYSPARGDLRLVTPLFYDLFNQTLDTATTGITTVGDFVSSEKVANRLWFQKSKLTKSEKSLRNSSIRFTMLHS